MLLEQKLNLIYNKFQMIHMLHLDELILNIEIN